MSVEQSTFTPEQIARAERREGFNHPVLSVIEQNLPAITQLNKRYFSLTDNQEQQKYIKEHLGFLADAFVNVGPYSMKPLDIVAIWSRVIEIGENVSPLFYHRYRLVEMISSAYAVQGATNKEWRKFPRSCLEAHKLPPGVLQDKAGLLYVKEKLNEIHESLKELDFYTYGTRDDPMGMVAKLAIKSRDGDKEAEKELNRLIAFEKTHETPVLGEIHENFANGLLSPYFLIEKILKEI